MVHKVLCSKYIQLMTLRKVTLMSMGLQFLKKHIVYIRRGKVIQYQLQMFHLNTSFFPPLSFSITWVIEGGMSIDAHRGGGWGGIKVYPPSKFFAKLVNKNAIKHQKGVPSPQNSHNPYIPSLPKFGKNLLDPPPRISNRVHLWEWDSLMWKTKSPQ